MKITINAQLYNSNQCEIIGEKDCYNYNNNYVGTNYLLRAINGQLLYMQTSNNQDCWRKSYICDFDVAEFSIDDFEFTDEQEILAVKYNLIKIV